MMLISPVYVFSWVDFTSTFVSMRILRSMSSGENYNESYNEESAEPLGILILDIDLGFCFVHR